MKGLLHSKRFKKNLQKWLFTYVGVLTLLTTVITYSKYISKFNGPSKDAQASKFNIEITQTTCPNVTGVCKATIDDGKGSVPTTCRPTQEIISCFNVDTTGLEVNSDLVLTFDPALDTNFGDGYYDSTDETNPNALFTIEKIELINGNRRDEIYPSDSTGNWTTALSTSKRLNLFRNINVINRKEAGNWTFMVTMKRVQKEDKIYSTAENNLKLVKVSYSMIQETKN